MLITHTLRKQITLFLTISIIIFLIPFTSSALSAAQFSNAFIDVSAGYSHTLAVKNDGSLWSWGENHYGQLGNGTTVHMSIPNSIPEKIMNDVISVSAGQRYSLAINTDGSLWAWGLNSHGQLGDGTITDRHVPVKIMDNVVFISAGYRADHTLAVKTDGSLWAWGRNDDGQIGDGTTTDRYKPVKIMDGVISAASGTAYSMAIKGDGSLWAWGSNRQRQLGDDTTVSRHTPVKVMDDVALVSASLFTTMIIKTDRSLWVCGSSAALRHMKIMDCVVSVAAGTSHCLGNH